MKDKQKNKKTKKRTAKPVSASKTKSRNAGTRLIDISAKTQPNPKTKPIQKKSGNSDGYAVPNFEKTSNVSNSPNEKSSSALPKKTESSNKKRRSIKILKVLLPVFLVISVSVIATIKYYGTSDLNPTSGFGSFVSSLSSGNGYPINIDNSGIVSTQRIGSGIMLLSNDSFEILNATAKEITRIQHTFLNPESDISNGRAIIYGRASGRIEVVDRSGVLYEKDFGKNILTASIGKKGNIAIASQSNSAQSELAVLNKNGKTVFTWECAAERISAIALSDNGKSVAVAVVGAENTELYSRVLVFYFDKSEPVVVFKYSENAIIKLKFGSHNTLIAMGDKIFSAISVKDNKKQDVDNGTGGVLERFYIDESGKTAMVLSPFGNRALSKLFVYGPSGNLLFETNCNQEVKWISCDESYVSILTQDEVQCFDNKGNRIGSFKADKYSERVVVVGKHTYLFEKGQITQYNTVGLAR